MSTTLGAYLRGILRDRRAQKARLLRREAVVREAIEQAVDGTDKSIRLALGYQRKLTQATEYCLGYADRLVDAIPASIEFSGKTFASDPRVNAFFVNVESLQNAFSHSSELRDFLDSPENQGLSECCALLCMRKTEKNVFGMQLVGDMVQREVAQISVSFTDYQVGWPAARESETRKSLKQCLFDGVINSVLERMSSDRARTKECHRQRHLLQNKLKTLENQPADTADRALQIEQVKARLTAVEERRRKVSRNTPLDYLHQLNHALSHPEELVRLELSSLTLNRFGVKIDQGSEQKGDRIDLAEVEIGSSNRRVVVLARFPIDEIQPRKDMVEEAARYLSV